MSQEFDNNILDLVKQEGFYPCEYMSNFKKFEEHLPSKEIFSVSWPVKNKDKDKEYEHVLKVWNTFQMKTIKYYHVLYIKCELFC